VKQVIPGQVVSLVLKSLPVNHVSPDPAAIFAIAHSLWSEVEKLQGSVQERISDTFSGMDGYMRTAMEAARKFEEWACSHVAFSETTEVWPYLLQDQFGTEYLKLFKQSDLTSFNDSQALRVALRLKLPIYVNDDPHIPVSLFRENPVSGSGIRFYQIKTVRNSLYGNYIETLTCEDDPFDSEYGKPYVGIYAIMDDRAEHIADRNNISDAIELVSNLAPSIQFPEPLLSTSR
jgi:hypothetical protein